MTLPSQISVVALTIPNEESHNNVPIDVKPCESPPPPLNESSAIAKAAPMMDSCNECCPKEGGSGAKLCISTFPRNGPRGLHQIRATNPFYKHPHHQASARASSTPSQQQQQRPLPKVCRDLVPYGKRLDVSLPLDLLATACKPDKSGSSWLSMIISYIPALGIICSLISVICFSFNSVIVKLLKTNYGYSGVQVLMVR